MCGLAGIWHVRAYKDLYSQVESMSGTLRHRGPDGDGIWTSPDHCLALAHRRLSIVDLTNAGAQPMVSRSGRTVIVLNGEVYNHIELRAELISAGVLFRGRSDTEVVLEAIEQWGLNRALSRFVGMFALAIWCARTRRLFLVRDRFGVKPLYYKYLPSEKVLFASQLQAFEAIGEARGVERECLRGYLKYGYVPGEKSIYKGIYRLMPGTYACFRPDGGGRPVLETVQRYWELRDIGENAEVGNDPGGISERLEGLLEESVRLRLLADVPVGLYLSGGVDSALVAAMAQKVNVRELRTFTIGFSEPGWPDESERAARIARHLGAAHTSWTPNREDIRQTANALPKILDEPFADPSIIPTCLVSQLARRNVTVALSGDGGDEGFLGYGRYNFAPAALRRFGWLGRTGASWAIPPIECMADRLDHLSPRMARRLRAATSVARASANADSFYNWSVAARDGTYCLRPELRGQAGSSAISSGAPSLRELNRRDINQYLPDDILYKVDRASMAVSLEAREPLLDHRLVEYGWGLPAHHKIDKNGVGKLPLRAVLAKHLPNDVLEGPKRGFGAPVSDWIRGPLREWARLYSDYSDGYTDDRCVSRLYEACISGSAPAQVSSLLWRILVFRAWHAERAGKVAI